MLFHQITAKLLFVSKRRHPGIQVSVRFLTTRVTKLDKGDWKKLVCLMQYICTTIDLVISLSVDSFNSIKWWVDASYATHHKMCSHMGRNMMLSRSSIYNMFCKQKINAQSSIEVELTNIDDVLGQILWAQNFLVDQGYKIAPPP